jgi:D-alanine-D-alanine ligase
MKKLRTLVVVHSSLVPPESLEGFSEKEIDEWRTEYDVVSTLRATRTRRCRHWAYSTR